MKYILVIIMCSGYQGMCLDPIAFQSKYDDVYSCLMDGYQKSIDKTEELGRKEINKHKTSPKPVMGPNIKPSSTYNFKK